MAKVQITDTILRDGHQSQAATRMRTDEMLPACEMLDKVGYYSLECWGGATYDACLRFLNEDPWERLRKLRKALPNTKLQMLLRGQNLLGYRPYADDVVDFFVKKAVENGIDIIRCFDALNDLRNMQTAVKATKKYGGTAEIAMSLHRIPRAQRGLLRQARRGHPEDGRGRHLHQGHGEPAAALQGVQPRQAPEEGTPSCPSSCTRTTPPARATWCCSRPSKRAWTWWTPALSPLGSAARLSRRPNPSLRP